jgi:formiminoglutamase
VKTLPPERFYQSVQSVDWKDFASLTLSKSTVVFLGFACDEGVKRNHGRVGAKLGPSALRSALANYPLHDKANQSELIDLGDIPCDNEDLEASQRTLANRVSEVVKKGAFSLVLGGGHETAWGHYNGFQSYLNNHKFAILNFDAHFDMRPLLSDGKGSSGTSFLQIANDRAEKNLPFAYYCVGIQKSANTQSLFQTAKHWDVNYITCDEVYDFPHQAVRFVNDVIAKHDIIYVSICLDAFSSSVAPGVSAALPNGLLPSQVVPLLRLLAKSGKVIALDIVELAPPLDVNGMTAKLGAFCLAEFLYQLQGYHHG